MSTEQEPDQLQLKQQLLKSEILDKNYDQVKFLKYCISQKENGDDLNNWTFDELKTCVNNFQESQKPKESDSKQSSSLNFFLSTAKSNAPPQPQPQTQNQQYPINQPYPYPNNSNMYNNQPYQNYPSYQQYQTNYQQKYQQYSPYQQYNPSYQQQSRPQYNPSSPSPLPGQQIPQGPTLIQSVNSLNPLQQMINSEKIQQRINSDILKVNLEHTDQSPPRAEFEIVCKKSEKTVLK